MNVVPKTLRHLSDLDKAGLAPAEQRAALEQVAARYAVAITPAMAELIDRADPHDPIARQFVPDAAELDTKPEERADPIGDHAHSPVEGVVHRYPDRALLKLTHVCAVYCRFCFRREMIGPAAAPLTAKQLDAALGYIAAHREIWEVVLTGGDPLVLSPRRLAETTEKLAAIPHVKVLRWHTRLPVVAPERVTKALTRALCRGHDKTVYVALHANHTRELTEEARAACKRLIDAGATLVSQSVLLKGVNDDADTLEALMRAFVEARVKPYYLHHPDLAPGTGHFRVSVARGQALMRALRKRLSGLAMPTYVLDQPGAHGKAPIGPNYAAEAEDGSWTIADAEGEGRVYRDALPD